VDREILRQAKEQTQQGWEEVSKKNWEIKNIAVTLLEESVTKPCTGWKKRTKKEGYTVRKFRCGNGWKLRGVKGGKRYKPRRNFGKNI